MKIYKLTINCDDYGLVRVLVKSQRRTFHSPSAFHKIDCYIDLEVISDNNLPLANISYFGGSFPICFDKKSYFLFQKKLNKFGIIKEAIVEGKSDTYYVFWPSNIVDCLDEERSDILVMPSGYKRLVKPVFLKNKTPHSSIFITPQFQTNSLFITEDIAETLKSSDLTGYILVDCTVS